MKRILFGVNQHLYTSICLFLVICFEPEMLLEGVPVHATPPGWKLVWSDEFEGSELDKSKWDAIDWKTPYNQELQAYHPSRVTVEGGNLVLTADDADYGGKSYTSGKVESRWRQQFGRWEVRAKLPGTHGTWPAIWLLPDPTKHPWPSQGEIDIMENSGHQPHLTSSAYHYGPHHSAREFKTKEQKTFNLGKLENYHDEFHTYAVEWDKDKLKFFVDDVLYYTIHDADVGGFLSSQTAPAETLINVAVGGFFVEEAPPNETSVWPQKLLVDYVRVYEREENPPPRILINGGFETNDGSLAGWSTFGNNLDDKPNVQVPKDPTSSTNAVLMLSGQSNDKENSSGVSQGISVSPGDSISASLRAYVPAAHTITGTANRLEMSFDYFKVEGGKPASTDFLSSKVITIADRNSNNDQWLEHSLTDTVPANAVEARLKLSFVQPNNEQGAVYLDDIRFKNLDLKVVVDAPTN